jgi:hypothetical protein
MIEEKDLNLGRWVKKADKKWKKSSTIRKILKTVLSKVRNRLKRSNDRIEHFLREKDD